MSRRWQLTGLLVFSAVCAVTSPCAAEWDDFHIIVDPPSPTDESTFDLSAYRMFPDSGYLRIDQSINVHGNEIDVWVLIQDQHTRPSTGFLTVLTPGGAFFDDFGPLAAGTYQVNAELWLTPWPATSGGELYDGGSLQFSVTSAGAHETIAGDFNGDNAVNAGDYVGWRKTGDASDVYNFWRTNFGETAGGVSPVSGAVPEPATTLLLLFAIAGGFARQRTF